MYIHEMGSGDTITIRTEAEAQAESDRWQAEFEARLASKSRVGAARKNIAKQLAALQS